MIFSTFSYAIGGKGLYFKGLLVCGLNLSHSADKSIGQILLSMKEGVSQDSPPTGMKGSELSCS